MATKSEHVFANAMRADSSGVHKIPVGDSTDAASRTISEPPSQTVENGNHGDLPWLLAAVGVILTVVVGLKYIAPGFLAGLVLGLFLVLLAQAALVWFVWQKVQARREDSIGHSSVKMLKAESPKPGSELERQASVSNEGSVWVATKPPATEWPKVSQRNSKVVLSLAGWAPQKRQAKLHFNMLILAGPDGEREIVKLDGCVVRTVSANGGPERKWSKKFPISIQHAERILFSNSRELLLYCASGFEKESWCTSLRHAATLHLPGQPFVLKMREDYASFIELVRQLAGGGEDWLASDPHEKEAGSNSSIGKWRAKLRRRSKGRFASWGSAEEAAGSVPSPSGRPSSPPRKGESDTEDSAKKEGPDSGPRSGGHSKVRSLLSGRRLTFGRKKAASDVGERSQGSSFGGGSVLSEDEMSDAGGVLSGDEFSAGEESGRKSFVGDALTPGLGEADDAPDGKVEGENIIRFGKKGGARRAEAPMGAPDGGIRFSNVMFARFFFDMARNAQVAEMIKGRIERKLARVETPSFMGSLKCTHFDLGTKPPLARAMRVLPSSQTLAGVSVEVDFEYQGGAKLTLETRLDMRAYANAGLFKNISDKPGEKPEDLVGNAELVAAGLASKGLEKGEEVLEALKTDPGKAPGRRLKGNFHSAMNNVLARLKPVVQHVTEQVSMVPLTLTVTVLGIEGTARLMLGPPPTDRLWFGFSEMPDLELESRPSVGQLNITRNPLAAWMVERLRNLLRESLVFPQSEDITIPYMLNDQDEVYQGEPPPAWKRKPPSASDLVPPVAPPLAGSPKPGFPAPGSPGGLGGTGLIQTPPKTPTPGGVLPGSPGVSAQTPPKPHYEPVPSPASSSADPLDSKLGIGVNSPQPGRSYPTLDGEPVGLPGVVGHLPLPSAVSPVTSEQGAAHRTFKNEAALGTPTSNLVHLPNNLVSETLALGVEEKAGSAGARAPGIEGSLLPGVSKGLSVARGARDLKTGAGPQQDVAVGSIGSHSESEVQLVASKRQGLGIVSDVGSLENNVDPSLERNQGGVVALDGRAHRQNAGGVNEGERAGAGPSSSSSQPQGPESHLAAIGEGNETTAAESEEDNSSIGRAPRGEGRGVREQGGLHPSSSGGPTTGGQEEGLAGVQDPFPPVDDHAHAGGAVLVRSPPKGPLDPWDLVAQGRTRFPEPAAPDAFRNGSPEQPEAPLPAGGPSFPAQGVALEQKQGPAGHASGRSEGLLEEQDGSSGSDRSLGSADSAADVAADVAGNRKAMMLGYGKKIGLSFRERGRKYLEKGRLGTLLHKGEGEGAPQQ